MQHLLFMPTYYFLYLAILVVIAILLIRFFILRRTSPATRLFIKAMKAENDGNYEEATTTYENALIELQKIKFQQSLKARIKEKLKVLHTVNNYKTDQGFIREKNL